MTSRPNNFRYRVIRTEQFDETWQRAIDAGIIDPLVGPSRLRSVVRILATEPHHPEFQEIATAGAAVNLRRLWFDPGVTHSVYIWYCIAEDDLRVYLVYAKICYPTQPGLPGFE